MRGIVMSVGALLLLNLASCVVKSSDEPIDQALLAQYRTAIPKETQVSAKAPNPSMAAKLGDPAIFPKGSNDIVVGINGSVKGMIDILGAVVALEPTLYNSDTKEFVWGPYDNDNGVGTIAVYIKEANGDFKYEYAFLRGIDKDLATMKPVIFGGATPDPNGAEHGAGVTLWDFVANNEFEAANNPDYKPENFEQGRFVAVYAKGVDEKGNDAAYVLAALRNFVSKDNPTAAPASVDYLFGHYDDKVNTIDFLNWTANIDIDNDPMKTGIEDVDIKMAFLNEGTGRAEVMASGGDLGADTATGVECWGKAIEQTYLTLSTMAGPVVPDEGTVEACGIFKDDFKTLGIPTLDAVDPALKAALDDAATNGIK